MNLRLAERTKLSELDCCCAMLDAFSPVHHKRAFFSTTPRDFIDEYDIVVKTLHFAVRSWIIAFSSCHNAFKCWMYFKELSCRITSARKWDANGNRSTRAKSVRSWLMNRCNNYYVSCNSEEKVSNGARLNNMLKLFCYQGTTVLLFVLVRSI